MAMMRKEPERTVSHEAIAIRQSLVDITRDLSPNQSQGVPAMSMATAGTTEVAGSARRATRRGFDVVAARDGARWRR